MLIVAVIPFMIIIVVGVAEAGGGRLRQGNSVCEQVLHLSVDVCVR